NTPALGAVAFWSSGQFGHVAIVSAIWSDGRVDIEEYNNTPYAYTKRSRVVAEKYLHIHDLRP
ncbi:MAG: hypothetical protein QG597_1535, partial [Actinomycetota bacterium]|nr:hypothetical protein [Actinomycetota bacterium]